MADSANFWIKAPEGTGDLRISFEDINVHAIKESLMLCVPLAEDTLIKNIKTVPAAGHALFNVDKFSVRVHKYWSYKLKTIKEKSKQEKIDALEKAFDLGFSVVRQFSPS